MDADDFKKIEEMFKHQVGIMSEDFQHKLDIVVEGHQMLSEKIDRLDGRMDGLDGRMDRLEGRMDRLEAKVDAVAADLTAHRTDTEAHGTVYRVKESGE
ncbi:MAG: hypothetical protein FD174_604 [Geobacteraceae bacterium]|nr:MAG: hypothetical protein FD174_604 [Geobacteraceae bacterium]